MALLGGLEVYVMIAAGVAAVHVFQRYQNWERWSALSTAQFYQEKSLVYPGLSVFAVQRIIALSCGKGRLSAPDLNAYLDWVGWFNRKTDDTIIEVTIRTKSVDARDYESVKEGTDIYLRWRILVDDSNNRLELCPETIVQSSATEMEERILEYIFADVESRLLKLVNQFVSNNQASDADDVWAVSSSINGVVDIARRSYEHLDLSTADFVLSEMIATGGVLREPSSGMQFLKWRGRHWVEPQPDGELFEAFIAFSQYGNETELTEELAIRWALREDNHYRAVIHVDCAWTGEFYKASGDLIRHLMETFEAQLVKNGAVPMQAAISPRSIPATKSPVKLESWYGDSITDAHAKPFWPSLQDYNEAIQNPHLCFADPELKAGFIVLNRLGLPKVASGAFASVYRMSCGNQNYAVRCFSKETKDQEERYRRISSFVCDDALSYTVPIHFLEQGIKIRGLWFPVLKMEWVEGVSIYQYVEENRNNQDRLSELRKSFFTMISDLRNAGVAHSDLQHGNIIMRGDELILVDYDGMFVPALSGFLSHERGHPNYQHPAREGKHFGPYLDNFSAWLIDSALLGVMVDPGLWTQFSGDGESLLFKRSDLEHPSKSALFEILKNHPSQQLQLRAKYLLSLLEAQPERVPPLSDTYPALRDEEDRPLVQASGLPDWMR